MKRDFKGVWIPKQIWLDTELTIIEKCFLAEIDSLDNENGCFASNQYFSKFFGLTKSRCSQIIRSLHDKKRISIQHIYKGKEIVKRVCKILPTGSKYITEGMLDITGGYVENADDNSPLFNNPINNPKNSIKEENCEFELLPESERLIKNALKKSIAFFETYPDMVEIYKSGAKINDPEFDFLVELENWIRNKSDDIYFLNNIEKNISKNFALWLGRYNQFKRNNQTTSNHGKRNKKWNGKLSSENAREVLRLLNPDGLQSD